MWSRVVECHTIASRNDPQVAPETVKIDRNWPGFHLVVKLPQHWHPCCAIAGFDGTCERPLSLDGPASREDRPKRVLQPKSVTGTFANIDVSSEAKNRSSPIG